MAVGTKIEWTHRPGTIPATMNALVGCQKVSDGCRGCYAIETAHVRAGNPLPVMQQKFAGTTKREGGKTLWTGKVTLSEEALLAPLRKKKPHTYFVNSMSDLFYDGVPDEWIDRHFAVFALCPQHTFIVLTKRPERMLAYFDDQDCGGRLATARVRVRRVAEDLRPYPPVHIYGSAWPLPNVWLGVSVENQKTAEERIPLLLQTPAAIRFLSCEPLLGPVDVASSLTHDLTQTKHSVFVDEEWWYDDPRWICENGHLSGMVLKSEGLGRDACLSCLGRLRGYKERIDWVIAGGESGRNARPMHPDWARSLRDQCAAAGVPFFFKQWGEWAPTIPGENGTCMVSVEKGRRTPRYPEFFDFPDGLHMLQIGKTAAGDLLDGVQHHAFPEVR